MQIMYFVLGLVCLFFGGVIVGRLLVLDDYVFTAYPTLTYTVLGIAASSAGVVALSKAIPVYVQEEWE